MLCYLAKKQDIVFNFTATWAVWKIASADRLQWHLNMKYKICERLLYIRFTSYINAFFNCFSPEPTKPTIITGESSVQMLSAVNYRATIGTNITTVIGNNITFVCVAEGRPRPGVSWWKDDLELNVNETAHVVYATDTNATGVYSCVARNLAGSITTSSTVTVLG